MNATLDRLKADNVRLFVRGIRLDVDAPVGSLTPELTDWLRAHKTALIEAIELTGPCDRCRNPECVDIPIHNGASIRRDCSICGRTWGFPTWTPEIDRPPRFNVAAERHANAVAQADSVSANRKSGDQTSARIRLSPRDQREAFIEEDETASAADEPRPCSHPPLDG